MIHVDQARHAFTGPIPSVRTPFAVDGTIDEEALCQQIDAVIAGGARSIVLTAGDSHYIALSDEEIARLTRATVRRVSGRAVVVAADRYFATRRAVEFADYCADTGADILMPMPPDWAASSTPETLANHYAAVAERIPVMIVTNVFVPRGEAFGIETVERALAASDNIVAIKDDMCGPFARRLALAAHERCALFSGGQKQNHLNMHPYGCDGYFSVFATLKPEIARRYWGAIERGDMDAAVAVVRDIDMPFFRLLMSTPGGFDAGIHGALELLGLGPRWRRAPYYSLDDEEMERLAEGLREIGVL